MKKYIPQLIKNFLRKRNNTEKYYESCPFSIRLDNEDIPPEVYQELMHKVLDEHYHKFIDESIPLLNGYTPREAAKKPGLRPQLLDLIKGHIHNNEKLARDKGNEPYDLSWLLDELGLDELK